MRDNVYSRLCELADGFHESAALDRYGVKPTVEREARFLELNRAALEEARGLVRRPCAVEVEYDYSFISRSAGPLSGLGRLCTAFCLLFHESRRRGDFAACAELGLDLLRLAQGCRRGGIVIDALTAAGIEGSAVNLLRGIRGRFNSKGGLHLARDILSLEQEREPFEVIQGRDDDWERRVERPPPPDGPPPPREPMQWSQEDIAEHGLDKLREFEAELEKLSAGLAQEPREIGRRRTWECDQSRLALRRLLAVELAAQEYQARHGMAPLTTDELTPGYLVAEPLDPFSGRPFRLRQGPTFAAYSVGPYGADFGGILGSYSAAMCYKCNFGVDCFDYQAGDQHDPPPQPRGFARWVTFLRRLFRRSEAPASPSNNSDCI